MDERKKLEIATEEIDRLGKIHGEVSVDTLLKEAKKKASPLHDMFEWDDSIAAQKWREEQAGNLIRAVRMVAVVSKRVDPVMIRAYLPLAGGESRYLPRAKALTNAEARALFINSRLSLLKSWCDEASDIDEFKTLRRVILKELASIAGEEAA